MQATVLLQKKADSRHIVQTVEGVFCTEKTSIQDQNSGYAGSGQMILRIPDRVETEIALGDRIARPGTDVWYVVTEIQDNRRPHSFISHRRVVGKR